MSMLHGDVGGVAETVVTVSVVRDFPLYRRLVAENRFLAADGVRTVAFDNVLENRPIPVRYNDFLAARPMDEESWYVFCHEDFEFLQPIAAVLGTLDRSAIYGVTGADERWDPVGNMINCRRDGSCRSLTERRAVSVTPVETVDCCCLIVHSSLIRRHALRFDPELAWDFYSEDFSIAASERHGIPTRVVPFLCRHWSYGTAGERFCDRLVYMRRKWRAAGGVYRTTTLECLGNRFGVLRARFLRRLSLFLWYRRFVARDAVKVSCCRIPIFRCRIPLQKLRRYEPHV